MRHERSHRREIWNHRERPLVRVPRRELWRRFGGVDDDGVDPAAQVAVDLTHEVTRRKAIRLPVLSHDVTDVDDLTLTGANRLSDTIDEEAGDEAGIEIA